MGSLGESLSKPISYGDRLCHVTFVTVVTFVTCVVTCHAGKRTMSDTLDQSVANSKLMKKKLLNIHQEVLFCSHLLAIISVSTEQPYTKACQRLPLSDSFGG